MEQNSQPDYQPRVITCVYCGQAYPQDTPTWGDAILTEHIKVCEKHPMRKAEETIKMLRRELGATIGAETEDELLRMKKFFETSPDVDSVAREFHLSSVNAMLETLEYQ